MRASWRQNLLLAAVVAVLGAALLYPIALIVGGAFRTDGGGFTLRHLISVFEDPATRRGLVNATLIAAMTTARIIGKQPQLELTNGTLIPSFFMLVAVFWYPLFDSLQVYVRRLSQGKSPFIADRSHVHHKLLSILNKNHITVTILIISALLIISLVLLTIIKTLIL